MNKFLFFFLVFVSSCTSADKQSKDSSHKEEQKASYPNDVGDIRHDASLDYGAFALCDSNRTLQGRTRLRYSEGNKALEEKCKSEFNRSPDFKSFTGYVTVRFMMNCKNETGRFRALPLDLAFGPQEFSSALQAHLIDLTKNLDAWVKSPQYSEDAEYSKFINFKFSDGNLEHIIL